jgi:hypothetical protein
MSRNFERSIARAQYAEFAKKWRRDKRTAGVYGEPGYKRLSFSEWNAMNKNKTEEKQTYTPVQEQLSLDDPWLEENPWVEPKVIKDDNRGVVTINIAGSEDE